MIGLLHRVGACLQWKFVRIWLFTTPSWATRQNDKWMFFFFPRRFVLWKKHVFPAMVIFEEVALKVPNPQGPFEVEYGRGELPSWFTLLIETCDTTS